MFVEIVGIASAVTIDIRAVRIFGGGPEVVSLRVEIVQPARAARCGECRDSDRWIGKVGVSCGKDTVAIRGGDKLVSGWRAGPGPDRGDRGGTRSSRGRFEEHAS